ncbi:hypothetical protein H2203_005467 [Taxawa tesnikishii (nom. ined.)]|nr:hypothetical protein H2203_005467 [Dothideales sp. JES 119]
MADSKRNSTAGKSAAPKAMQDTLEALGTSAGARIRLTTLPPTSLTLEGTLFTADPRTNLLALNTKPAPPNPSTSLASQPGDYHIVPVAAVQSFEVLALADVKEGQVPQVAKIDIVKLREKEQNAIKRAKEAENKRGKGVSKEGQAIFDAFHRLMPTRWHEQAIIVSDAVIISPPYRLEDCKAPKEKQQALNQVKKVLEGTRRKIANSTPVTGGIRKGG